MNTIDTVVVGAGHAGLAVSRLLADAGREHVVLERGRVAERWRTERRDSLHLLTPAWMTRLPGYRYGGYDPERYLSATEVVSYLSGYAQSFLAPVFEGVRVEEVTRPGSSDGPFVVETDSATLRARNVVVATGPNGVQTVPEGVDSELLVTSSHYRNPDQLPDGAVLVVGASSSGVQIADELARAGRDVALAVGRHTRMPRRYRGMDAFWWLESTGRLSRTVDEVADVQAVRGEPSLQLIGRNVAGGEHPHADLDLATLHRRGVQLTGHLDSITDGVARFRDDLEGSVLEADRRMHRFLDAADAYATDAGLDDELWPSTRPTHLAVPGTPDRIDLRTEGYGAVVLVTGYRPDHSWMRIRAAADAGGTLTQHRGITPIPGLYVVGQRFQHRRDSGFIDGARHDAGYVVSHLLARDGDRAAVDEQLSRDERDSRSSA